GSPGCRRGGRDPYCASYGPGWELSSDRPGLAFLEPPPTLQLLLHSCRFSPSPILQSVVSSPSQGDEGALRLAQCRTTILGRQRIFGETPQHVFADLPLEVVASSPSSVVVLVDPL